ncbi:WD40 repeat and Utp12 domain-containing protein [Aspergillus saccharolyticus JOP 1030-1]|uniref:Small nucleolar ribonucleo protein complex component n=1 Tax=Aspergillus saccharolyticus JOP 1030-1 TaxID=1450539 RepID=A0A318ZD27_9EURO|nr:small nucleolar ribonucleo protein complex component [Aspergillus saccharolyticus JOP 1030-1]PYH45229.1 small nucleolar ribonucleo protein complex component [Aspergillus saccharolyticus JOP 1030-1]
MAKKASRPAATKTSSAASPAMVGMTQVGNQSSILKASFAPSEYQLALFASVIQGLGAQHLRIHDTNTGRLQCEHVLGPKEVVTSLDWGYFIGRQKDKDLSKKKRKRNSDINGDAFDQGDVVVAFGTNTSEIKMYSPVEDKIVGTLADAHEKGIRDFKFTSSRPGQEGWSIGGDNKLVQWDLRTGQKTRSIHLPSTSTYNTLSRPLPFNPHVICASQTPYIVSVEKDESPVSFPAMRNPIRQIFTSSTESAATGLFLTSDSDRYINVFDIENTGLAMNLVAEQGVSSLALYTGVEKNGVALPAEKQVLAAVTEDGTIELFTRPFVLPIEQASAKGAASLKARSKQIIRRAEASIKVTISATSEALVSVVAAAFQGPELILVWADGGVIPVFERIQWLNEETDEVLFTGTKTIPRTKTGGVLGSVATNGKKSARDVDVDQTRVTVEQGNMMEDDVEMQDTKEDAVSMADSGEESDSDADNEKPSKQLHKKEEDDSDVEMGNGQESGSEEEEDETGEPSFGELVRANQEIVDVEAELEDDVHMGSLIPGKPNAAVQQIPSGVSLSTVLTQSLKTNDTAMLESCFQTSDLSIIRTTIQRLDSSLAATLLQKLAERLSGRPGRYGHLLVWVQWTCVAHGGALAGKPELLKRMSTLFKVMEQRASSLPSLLLLKGKLDMLDAQLGLRRAMHKGEEAMDSEDEENIIYVEGQEDEYDDSDAEAHKDTVTPRTKSIRDQTYDEEESIMNGVHYGGDSSEDEEEGSEEEEDEDENILDVEAEESAGSSDAEESLEEDEDEDDEDAASVGSMADFIADTEDEDESDDEVTSAPQPPPSKKARLSGGGGGRGKGKKAGKR